MKKFFLTYLLSVDTIFSILLSVFCLYYLPDWIGGGLIQNVVGMGISVLSITFSIFFAALAFIISASDDEFVKFLEETGSFTQLVSTFKWTVGSLFIGLIYSILLYVVSAFRMEQNDSFQMSEIWVAVFCFLFFYSLIATILTTNDAIKYSKRRSDYMRFKNQG